MLHKHDLHSEFPEFDAKIHELKVVDSHFKKLFDEYHEIDHEVHRIETGAEVTTDEVLNDLRLRRLKLKDQLYKILSS